jgi:hypothetical protein
MARALALVLGMVLVWAHSICSADGPPALNPESDQALAEQVDDPTARLTQFQTKKSTLPLSMAPMLN